jgi:hypothetical protein
MGGPSSAFRRTSKPSLEMVARSAGPLRRIAARLPTYLADLRENPAWLPMFLLARTMPGRRAHWRGAAAVPAAANVGPTLFAAERSVVVDALRAHGLFADLVLPDQIRDGILRFAESTSCFGNFDRRLEFLPGDHAMAEERFDRSILSGHYFERVLDCDAALAVQRDPLLLDVAAHYLGGQARMITTRVWWSFPTRAPSETDMRLASQDKFHFDLDDWRMLKFFFYLTAVDVDSGPHVYVRGSHNCRIFKHQATLLVGHPADEVLRAYGADNAVTLVGPAGLGFVEDPFGFHMGTVARRSPRLMMEVGFGVSPPSRRRFHGEPVVR